MTDARSPGRGFHSPSETVRVLAARLVEACCAARAENPADPRVAAAEGQIRAALEMMRGSTADSQTLASFGTVRSTVWLLRFEDPEMGEMIWDASTHGEAGAEILARDAYRRHSTNWNCTLLRTASVEKEK